MTIKKYINQLGNILVTFSNNVYCAFAAILSEELKNIK